MNVFKSSRFDCLNESNSQLNKRNSKEDRNNNFKEERNNNFKEERNFFKNDYSSSRRGNNRYDTKESKEKREQFEKMRKEKEEKAKEEQNQKKLSADNFPTLHGSNVKITETIGKKESYVEKINKISIKEPSDVEHIKPGWVEVKRDPENPRKLIYTYGLELETEKYSHSKESSKKKLEPQVLDALVELHNKRTQEYIDMWGYDTWEKLYRFPNYDYHYFDKLDEKYEEELEKELEEDEDEY
jgi:hypothetical protein